MTIDIDLLVTSEKGFAESQAVCVPLPPGTGNRPAIHHDMDYLVLVLRR